MSDVRNHAIIMLGLPGSGKSTYIKEEVDLEKYSLVSADEIRLNHPKYDKNDPEAIHEECVKLAEQEVYRLMGNRLNLIMDGGGINNNYTARIVLKLKENNYKVSIIYINTPVDICLQRNKERIANNERFVPHSVIIDKYYKLQKSIERLTNLADELGEIKYFTDRDIFIDMDGIVVEYQDLPVDENGDIDFVSHNIFRNAKPVTDVIERFKRLAHTTHLYILSASPNSICNQEKIEWLKEHMPFIKEENMFFVGNRCFKATMLKT